MSELHIQLENDRLNYCAGDSIEGKVSWNIEHVNSAILRFFWRTEGKGIQDIGLSSEMSFDQPQPMDSHPFRFKVPNGPWSYAGTLVAIKWTLELQVDPGGRVESIDVMVSQPGTPLTTVNP